MQPDNTDGWNREDFIDRPSASLPYGDPWDPLSLFVEPSRGTKSSDIDKLRDSRKRVVSKREEQLHPYIDASDSSAHHTSQSSDGGFDFPTDWFEDDSNSDSDEEFPEEPIPTSEFDPDLSEELYHKAEFIDLTDVEIRLDIFIAKLNLNGEQDSEIRAHFQNFSRSRLSNWLPWLNSKAWTSTTLSLFMQFHNFWESNPEWWESKRYRRRYGWQSMVISLSNILSRDDAYEIVHDRVHFPPDEIIASAWFDEWDYHSLWRHGFWSFAKFAKFRASLNEWEEWESLIQWRSLEEDLESESTPYYDLDHILTFVSDIPIDRENDSSLYSYTTSLSRWYHIQDWYPEHEWHDNLGRETLGTEIIKTHDPKEGPQGPIWPIGGRNE